MSGSMTNPPPAGQLVSTYFPGNGAQYLGSGATVSGLPCDSPKSAWGGGAVTAIAVNVPPSCLPNTPVWVTGTMTGGYSSGIQLTFNAAGYLLTPQTFYTCDQQGNWGVYLPQGIAAGSYTIAARDGTAGVVGASGASAWVVSATANPSGPTSGNCIWYHDPNDPTLIVLADRGVGSSNGARVQHILNKVNPGQYLSAVYGSQATPPIWLRNTGTGTAGRRMLGFTTPASSITFDPTANGFTSNNMGSTTLNMTGRNLLADGNTAGPILQALNAASGGTGNWTTIYACRWISNYGTGPIWFNLAQDGLPGNAYTLTYRVNSGNFASQLYDGTNFYSTAAATPGAGYYVLSVVKNGSTLTPYINQTPQTGLSVSPLLPLQYTHFGVGPGNGASTGQSMNCMAQIGAWGHWDNALSGGDLANMITLVGSSAGLVI